MSGRTSCRLGGQLTTRRERGVALVVCALVVALAVVVFPQRPASAAVGSAGSSALAAGSSALAVGSSAPRVARADVCSVEEWQTSPATCVSRLADVTDATVNCLKEPPPGTPDAGLAGWFATRPEASSKPGQKGYYTEYGYAGYSFTTYDLGCSAFLQIDSKFENTIANGEFMLATAVIGASNALRERAWDPGVMWGWADPLVEKATRAIYTRVFTVFGALTLVIVGLYLLWRSRQAEMSAAMTTAAWALLVMIVVTALASWPVYSANVADKALISSLGIVHDAVGPPSKAIPPQTCTRRDKLSCQDIRTPAVRAGDTAVETMLYRNWLRGLLGSAESLTAQKYGLALYQARTLSWAEAEDLRLHPELRDQKLQQKSQQWTRLAGQIKLEDPSAYEYLTGAKGMERIGAGFIALLAAIMFALFDLTASLLVLLGFLIFRWAVIAAPILGTVAILRPASAGFRRLANAVVAALFNVVIFGTGATIYLFAVDLIMSTPSLPGWLQVVLVFLCGVVGWLLLRPYRRITQLGGGRDAGALSASGLRRMLGGSSPAGAAAGAGAGGGDTATSGGRSVVADRPPQRVELRPESPPVVVREPEQPPPPGVSPPRTPRPRMPTPSGRGWSEPATVTESSYALYRPRRSAVTTETEAPPRTASRAEARRDV